MSTVRVGWIVWCAAVAFLMGRGSAAGEPWHAVEQPELKQALEKAPVLKTETLGEPARGCNGPATFDNRDDGASNTEK